ncbi:MAG TPA: winged helix-turn-helix domain-containing protein [Thermoanaerobaculia bacterium]|nr:winged helix-turn-helix domain-containing protein [Thermoanaerobaculia bacterium]
MLQSPARRGIRFDPATGSLAGEAGERRLTPKAAAVLELLIESPGRVVSKETLLDRVWDGAAVSDEALTTVVYELRQALGDSARDPRYIETLRRRGYRWIGPLPALGATGADRPQTGHRGASRWLVAAASWVAVLALAALGGPRRAAETPTAVPSQEACEAYYRSVGVAARGTTEAARSAVDHLEHALALAPSWASGHLALAEAYLGLARSTGSRAAERSWAAVADAERLGAERSEIHLVRAALRLDLEADVAGARAELEQARRGSRCGREGIDLRSAEVLSAAGRHDQALALLERLAGERPGDARVQRALGRGYDLAGRLASAEATLVRALELSPGHVPSLRRLALVRERRGDASGSWEALRDEAYALGLAPERLLQLEAAWRAGGLRAVRRWRRGHADVYGFSRIERAALSALTGEPERAAAELRLAREAGLAGLAWVAVEPGFEALRRDDRYRSLVAEITSQAIPTHI